MDPYHTKPCIGILCSRPQAVSHRLPSIMCLFPNARHLYLTIINASQAIQSTLLSKQQATNNNKRQTTTNNNKQQTTTNNDKPQTMTKDKQRQTTANNKRQTMTNDKWQTTTNNKQRPTTNDKQNYFLNAYHGSWPPWFQDHLDYSNHLNHSDNPDFLLAVRI